jgi:hypothetical protein
MVPVLPNIFCTGSARVRAEFSADMDRFLLSLPRKQPEVAHLKSPPLDAQARNKVNPKPYLLYPLNPWATLDTISPATCVFRQSDRAMPALAAQSGGRIHLPQQPELARISL